MRLQKDILLKHLRQLLLYQLLILCAGYHQYVFIWYDLGKPIVCLLQERNSCSKEIQKLLWLVISAYRPETASNTAGHDDTIIVLSSHICFIFYQVGANASRIYSTLNNSPLKRIETTSKTTSFPFILLLFAATNPFAA